MVILISGLGVFFLLNLRTISLIIRNEILEKLVTHMRHTAYEHDRGVGEGEKA